MGTAPHTTVGHPGYCSVYHLRMPALLMWLMWPLFFCFKDSILGRWFATICASRFHPVFFCFLVLETKALNMPGMHCTPKLIPRSCCFWGPCYVAQAGLDFMTFCPGNPVSGIQVFTATQHTLLCPLISPPALSPLAQEHGLVLVVITLWCAVLERLVRALL